MIYDTANETWSTWIDTSDGTSTLGFDGEQFTYSTGYLNYLYQAAYYSDFWSGSVSVIPYDNDGDGLNSLADCNDTDAGLGRAQPIYLAMELIRTVTVLMPILTMMGTVLISPMIVTIVTRQFIQVHQRFSMMGLIKTVMGQTR